MNFTCFPKKRLVLLLPLLWLVACNSSLQTFKRGQKKFDNAEYEAAIADFQASVARDPARINRLIAEAYRLSNRQPQAAEFYEKAFAAGLDDATARFEYGFALKAQGRYAEAAEQLTRFAKTKQTNRQMAEKARREIENLTHIDSLAQRQQAVALRNLEGLNTAGAEFAPVLQGNSLIFTASRKELAFKTNGQKMLGLYKSPLTASTETGPAALFSEAIFQENLNEGTPAFTKDGKTMVFARGNTGKRRGKGNTADLDLYVTRLGTTGWSEPALIALSDSAAWDAHPAFSADGRTLYFCSNRPGGAGGIDMYRANVDASGRFGRPVNLGRDLNTPGDEMFPYVSPEGKLYFASDGHPGLGRLDLFVATREDDVIKVENLGQPFNSRFDDFALVLADTVRGYFSSNREGGKGDDDIYFFEPSDQPLPPLIAQKPPKKDSTSTPPPTVAVVPPPPTTPPGDPTTPTTTTPGDPTTPGAARQVRYFLQGTAVDPANQPLDSVRVRVFDAARQTVADVTTPASGSFGPFAVKPEGSYSLVLEKKTYFVKRQPFSTVGKTIPAERLVRPVTDTTFFLTVPMDKPAPNLVINKLFEIKPIYYTYDKDNIRQDASPELDKIVQILKDNPGINLELGSHTDVRGVDIYNLDLSQRRAKSAVEYILSKGVAPGRITAKGYGETQLIIKNARTEAEHQRNRRTEFKVLRVQ